MKKLLAVLMTAVLCMSLLAACGNAAKEEASAPEASDAETEAGVEEAPAVNAEEPDSAAETEALADGVLTVGTNAEFPPFEYVGDNGEPDGFDIALIKAIGEKLGVEVQVENMEFDSLVASIGRKTDVAIAGMTITEERQESGDFSNSATNASKVPSSIISCNAPLILSANTVSPFGRAIAYSSGSIFCL